jgi:uncharacterized protein involved in cysteine biosynthesis
VTGYFLACVAAVVLPFLAERYYFRKPFGVFTALFRLFIWQVFTLALANAVMLILATPDAAGWLHRLGAIVQTVTVLSAGIIPLMSATTAVVALFILAFGWFTKRKAKAQ